MNPNSVKLSRKAALKLGFSAFVFGAILASCAEKSAVPNIKASDDTKDAEAVFYLVRHAEKELTGDDPALSQAGYARAQALVDVLQDIEFAAIYSTDTRRTRDTAVPTAAVKGVDVQFYDGRALTNFAGELSGARGNYLIVGHSNTTPQLAEALGGSGGDPIVEETEYDRLYVLTRKDGVTLTQIQRYP